MLRSYLQTSNPIREVALNLWLLKKQIITYSNGVINLLRAPTQHQGTLSN